MRVAAGLLRLVLVVGAAVGESGNAADEVPYAHLPEIPDVPPAAALQEAGRLLSSLLHQMRTEVESGQQAASQERDQLNMEVERVQQASARVQGRISLMQQTVKGFPLLEQSLTAQAEVHAQSITGYRQAMSGLAEQVESKIESKKARVSALRGVELTLAQKQAGIRNQGGNGDLDGLLGTLRDGVFDTIVGVEQDIVELVETLAANKSATRVTIEAEEGHLHGVNANLQALGTRQSLIQADLRQDHALLTTSQKTASMLGRQADNVQHTWEFERAALQEKIRLVSATVLSLPSA